MFQLKKIIKFFSFSSVATLVDFCLFTFVFSKITTPFYAEIMASSIGIIVNFLFQYFLVFDTKRKATSAFALSFTVSITTMTLGSLLMIQLVLFEFFETYLFAAKIVVMGSKAGLNYFGKKWVFEKSLK